MYYTFDRRAVKSQWVFTKGQTVHLMGSVRGLIVAYLREIFSEGLQTRRGELGQWRIYVPELMETLKQKDLIRPEGRPLEGNTLVMDLAPNDKNEIGLFEIQQIWGFTKYSWTPIMLESLPVLDAKRSSVPDASQFKVAFDLYSALPKVYSFLYMRDTRTDGGFSGNWSPPPASPTNTPVLWPEVFDYFLSEINYVKVEKRTTAA